MQTPNNMVNSDAYCTNLGHDCLPKVIIVFFYNSALGYIKEKLFRPQPAKTYNSNKIIVCFKNIKRSKVRSIIEGI